MKKISIGKAIKNDYAVFLMMVGGPIFFVISGFTAAFGFLPSLRGLKGQEVNTQFIIIMFIAAFFVTLLLFTLLIKRIAKLKHTMQTGIRATAIITSVSFFKDRGRLEFQYNYNDYEYHAGSAIMKNKLTERFISGSKIEVAIDPENPSKALIAQLYAAA